MPLNAIIAEVEVNNDQFINCSLCFYTMLNFINKTFALIDRNFNENDFVSFVL